MRGKCKFWPCVCDCGNRTIVAHGHLQNGHTKSCNCLSKELTADINKIHGKSKTAEFKVWSGMKNRCSNHKDRSYKNYGSRGIKVCLRWQKSFKNFLADMGVRPSPKHSIERKNNDKGYSPKNCVWAIKKVQANNTRANRVIKYRDTSKTLSQWSQLLKIDRKTLSCRIDRSKWSVEKAFTAPVRHWN